MSLLTPSKPLTIAFIALGISTSVNCVSAANDASRPVLATEQAALPGTGPNPGDNLRAQMQARPGGATAPMTGDTIHDSFGTPLIAREVLQGRGPAVPGMEPNTVDLGRKLMQGDPTAFAALGTRYPLSSGASAIANKVEPHGRGGWNPALVELQANPQPFPWESRLAKTMSEPTVKAEGKP
jgi:hypothetical protein